MLHRMAAVVALAVALVVGWSGKGHAEVCGQAPKAGVGSANEWLGRIHEEPDNISVLVDNGLGGVAERRGDEQQPIASAVKVVHLAAYARAVAAGTLDPQERVPVAEWERWYLPGTDGGAHEQARSRLPGDSVTVAEMVSAMIRESDNATPDYLRNRLGDQALIDAAAAGGWHGFVPPSLLGMMIRLSEPGVDAWAAAQRYANDPLYRIAVQSRPIPSFDAQLAWVETTHTASARQLTALHRSLATGAFGAGADIARAQLEWQQPPAGFAAIGFKGGSLAGVLTDAIYLRRTDGTVATAVLLNRRMPGELWVAAMKELRQQELLFKAMVEPPALAQLTCAL